MLDLSSKKWLWTGRVVSVLAAAFMVFDGVIHILRPPVVIQSFQQGGYSLNVIVPLAIIELICVALYIIPRTSVLGAILLTGYLGGAVDYNVRAGNALFGFVLFPVSVAVLLWMGLYLRNEKLRAVLRWHCE
ncbi:MAG TPA: DoxX family protein [Candidatus Paceibacterota bacterium]|nr:DoxX family protein [Candidatus Paceibacterota bacterium]